MPPHLRRSPTTDDADIVAELSDQLAQVLGRVSATFAELAADPDPQGPREQGLQLLIDERDELARRLGGAVMRALAAGGTLRVTFPEETPPEPVPEPPKRQLGEAVIRPPDPEEHPPRGPLDDPADAATEYAEPAPKPVVRERPPQTSRTPPPPPSRRPPPARLPAPRTLSGHLELIGRPRAVTHPEAASAAMERLVEATAHVDSWLGYPQEVQRALVGLASSIARHLQDEAEALLDANAREAIRAWFPVMTQWSKLYRPGFVPGLSRRFGPDHDSWQADAEHWWWVLMDVAEPGAASVVEVDARAWVGRSRREPPEETLSPAEALEAVTAAVADPEADLAAALQAALDAGVPQRDPRLVAALLPHADRVTALPRFKTLKSALREAMGSGADDDVGDDDDDDSGPAPAVPDDWPFLALTEGKRAVIVGGDRRPRAAERIRGAFRFADVEWELKEPRRLKGLAERVRSRSVDFVIVLRAFIGHAEQETVLDACRAADVPFVIVDSGYGVNQVKLAIERFCNL
ncbi:MAG: hypothetical protein R3F59_38760 [Myxococcota bacterium]